MRWLTVLALASLVSGCAAKKSPRFGEESLDERYVDLDFYETDDVDMMAAPKRSRAESAPMAPPPPPPPPMAMEPAPEPEPDPSPEPDGPDRMVHYDGWAQIRTPRSEELVEQVVALVDEAGGHVETRSLRRVSARVPVEAFSQVWDSVLELGPVVSKELAADDVTDAFTDLSLRVDTLRATRDRLQALLAKATEERDKLQLVQQIHRLTEQLEVLEAQVRTLADLAALSRLTVTAVAPDHHVVATAALPAGMSFIDRLSAFDRVEHEALSKPVSLDAPEGFVRLDPRQARFESADGASLWAFRLPNEPAGAADWWRQAVIDRIGEQLDDGSVASVGGWELVRFVEQGATEPYVWHVGFRVDGKHLQVLQVTYPTQLQEDRYHQAVRAVLGGGAS
jgi:hypothetical protein